MYASELCRVFINAEYAHRVLFPSGGTSDKQTFESAVEAEAEAPEGRGRWAAGRSLWRQLPRAEAEYERLRGGAQEARAEELVEVELGVGAGAEARLRSRGARVHVLLVRVRRGEHTGRVCARLHQTSDRLLNALAAQEHTGRVAHAQLYSTRRARVRVWISCVLCVMCKRSATLRNPRSVLFARLS